MTQYSERPGTGMVLVGRAVPMPGSPCGDIYVSEALIAQRGTAYVRQMVRETFEAAHRTRRRVTARDHKN